MIGASVVQFEYMYRPGAQNGVLSSYCSKVYHYLVCEASRESPGQI